MPFWILSLSFLSLLMYGCSCTKAATRPSCSCHLLLLLLFFNRLALLLLVLSSWIGGRKKKKDHPKTKGKKAVKQYCQVRTATESCSKRYLTTCCCCCFDGGHAHLSCQSCLTKLFLSRTQHAISLFSCATLTDSSGKMCPISSVWREQRPLLLAHSGTPYAPFPKPKFEHSFFSLPPDKRGGGTDRLDCWEHRPTDPTFNCSSSSSSSSSFRRPSPGRPIDLFELRFYFPFLIRG